MLKYYKHVVLYNNSIEKGIGIITGWKNPPEIKEKLSEDSIQKVMTIGTLYTTEGINHVIANLFLNPQITHLILLEDSDIKGVSKSVLDFLEMLKNKKINFQLQYKFTEEQIVEFCEYFQNHITVIPSKMLNETIPKIQIPDKWREDIVEVLEIDPPILNNLTSEKMGFNIHAKDVRTAWLRCAKLIGNYGYRKTSDYDEEQLELMNLSMVVQNENLDNPSMVGYLGITKEELEEYANSLLSAKLPDSIRYTYGARFRDYEGIDQLDYLEKILRETKYTRRCVATLWNPNLDTIHDEVPCINLYQGIIQDEKLHFLAYFRSNDMLNGYPRNIYGILKIQSELCKRLNLARGYVGTTAGSAHIYSRDFNNLSEIINKKVSFCEEDPRGYFVVDIINEQIVVSFYRHDGVLQRKFVGKTADELRSKCCFLISNMDHAFYLGQELMKAEIALKNNIPFIQDKDLPFLKQESLKRNLTLS